MSTTRRSRSAGLISAFLCAVLLVSGAQSSGAEEPAPEEFAAALREAQRLSAEGKHRAAIEAYDAANALAGGESAHCLLALAILHNATGDHESAAASARRVAGLTEEPQALGRAYRELGLAVALSARTRGVVRKERSALRRLAEAEQALRQAVALNPGDGESTYLLASVLADRMVTWEQWSLHDEVKTFADRYLELESTGPQAEWARKASCKAYQTFPTRQQGRSKEIDLPARDSVTGEVIEGEIVAPVKLSTPAPQYTEWARQARIEGQVVVQAIIDQEGNVSDPQVLQGLPLCLSEVAAATVATWRFKPALMEGEPVDVYYNLKVNFKLR